MFPFTCESCCWWRKDNEKHTALVNTTSIPDIAKKIPDLEMWTKLFKSFDKDGGGSIDFSEFKGVLIGFGSAGDVESFFQQVDTDGSGELDADEFSVMCNLAVDKVFSLLDADSSGNLSSGEIADHCKSVDCKDFIAAADVDGDGEVSKAEFKLAIASNPKFLCVLFSVI